jgi:hypothetical protein
MELARAARTPEHKKLLTELAQSWINFAADIERVQTILKADGAVGAAPNSASTEQPTRPH